MSPQRRLPWSDAEPDEADMIVSAAWPAQCPAPELLHAAREGVLPADLQAQVSAHVESCAVCRVLEDALDGQPPAGPTELERARILARIRAGLEPSPRRISWAWIWRPAIAAGTVAALAVISLRFIGTSINVPATTSEPPRIARVAPGPQLPSVFRIEKAPAQLPGTGLLWRGAQTNAPADEDQELARALQAYESNDFAEAVRRLRALTARRPDNAAGQFYLGVSELVLGQSLQAAADLVTAQRLTAGDADRSGETAWYLALAFQQMGQRDQATAVLEPLCRARHARSLLACAALLEFSTGSDSRVR